MVPTWSASQAVTVARWIFDFSICLFIGSSSQSCRGSGLCRHGYRITTLSIESRAADPGGDRDQPGRPLSSVTGERSSASRASRCSGSIPAASSCARGAANGVGARSRRRRRRLGGPQRPRERRGRSRSRRRGRRCASSSPARRARARSGRPTISTGKSRSRTMRRITASLLGVLLAEEGDVGPDHVEELGDDRGDAAEVAGPAPRRVAVEHLGQAARPRPRSRSPAGTARRPWARRPSRRRPRRRAGVALLVARVARRGPRRGRTGSG